MYYFKGKKTLVYAFIFCISLFLFGCDTTTNTTTEKTNKENTTTETNETKDKENTDKTDKTDEVFEANTIEAKEPEKYEAKVSLKLEAIGGESKTALPSLEAKVARVGNNKRMEINAPTGQKLVYLETDGKKLLLIPAKKQYAEINKESVGMNIQSLMTPEEIVKRAKGIKGLEKVGEEKYNGRDAVKYKYSATTKTNTKAGDVDTESNVFVDKETGLPLKTEIISSSKDSNVQGFSGIKIVTEMSDIKTEVSEELFKQPEDFEKIDEQQVRSQLNLVFNVIGQFLKQMMEQGGK